MLRLSLTKARIGIILLVLLLLFIFRGGAHSSHLPAHPSTATIRERLDGVSVGAHRGGSWHLSNNTMKRFEAARLAGADIIEMDIRLTKDQVPVVMHDPEVWRVWGKEPLVAELTREELEQYSAPVCQPIPTFEEVVAWAAGRVVINAEFKELDVVGPAVALVQKHRAHEWVYFQCKSDPKRYEAARLLDPQVALLFKPETMEQLDWALGLDDDRLIVIEIAGEMLTPEVVQRVHAADKLLSFNAWRLDPFQELFGANCKEVWAQGVDIAITKRPESAVKQREAWRE